MAEMDGHLAQLVGSHATGTIQIQESALNEMIHVMAGPAAAPAIQLLAANQVEVRYGMIHVHAELPAELQPGPSPRVTLLLRSWMVALMLRATLRHRFVEVHGRRVTIHLAGVPALVPYRALLPHVTRAQFETGPGVLRVRAEVVIEIGGTNA